MVAVADGQGTVLAEYVYWPTGLSRAEVRDPAGADLNWNRLWQGQRLGLEDGMYNRGGRLYDPFSGTTASPSDGAASRVADPNVDQGNLPDTWWDYAGEEFGNALSGRGAALWNMAKEIGYMAADVVNDLVFLESYGWDRVFRGDHATGFQFYRGHLSAMQQMFDSGEVQFGFNWGYAQFVGESVANGVTIGMYDQAKATIQWNLGSISADEWGDRMAVAGASQILFGLTLPARANVVLGRGASYTRPAALAVGEVPEELIGLCTRVKINAERTLALQPSAGGTGPLRWQVVSRARKIHGNSLLATGPHDVYAITELGTGRVLHLGETGQLTVRKGYWRRYFHALGIDTETVPLRRLDGKFTAKKVETRYIQTYRKIYGQRPPYNKTDH